jgi:hypothetical protein
MAWQGWVIIIDNTFNQHIPLATRRQDMFVLAISPTENPLHGRAPHREKLQQMQHRMGSAVQLTTNSASPSPLSRRQARAR